MSRGPASSTPPAAGPRRRYRHGNLARVLLEAAEEILREQGVGGLKLRAIAKRAGVSHTAADPHFGDLAGLLSELAAIGYERLCEAITVRSGEVAEPMRIAHGYIGFARANPQLFVLMFRGDVLDMARPRLRIAAAAAYAALAAVAGPGVVTEPLSLAAAGRQAAAWGIVHGLATLLINDRLKPILGRLDPGIGPEALIDAALGVLSLRAVPEDGPRP